MLLLLIKLLPLLSPSFPSFGRTCCTFVYIFHWLRPDKTTKRVSYILHTIDIVFSFLIIHSHYLSLKPTEDDTIFATLKTRILQWKVSPICGYVRTCWIDEKQGSFSYCSKTRSQYVRAAKTNIKINEAKSNIRDYSNLRAPNQCSITKYPNCPWNVYQCWMSYSANSLLTFIWHSLRYDLISASVLSILRTISHFNSFT